MITRWRNPSFSYVLRSPILHTRCQVSLCMFDGICKLLFCDGRHDLRDWFGRWLKMRFVLCDFNMNDACLRNASYFCFRNLRMYIPILQIYTLYGFELQLSTWYGNALINTISSIFRAFYVSSDFSSVIHGKKMK